MRWTQTSAASLALSIAVVGCVADNPDYCASGDECLDPSAPFCDIEGAYEASHGKPHTCIARPSALTGAQGDDLWGGDAAGNPWRRQADAAAPGKADDRADGGAEGSLTDAIGDTAATDADGSSLDAADDADPSPPVPADADGDGDPDLTDCAPHNPSVHHGKAEACNGVDDDCDSVVDEVGAIGCTTHYQDADGDGFGDAGRSACLCAPQEPYRALSAGDCNDNDPAVHSGLKEDCATLADDDCSGTANDEGATGCKPFYEDLDGDDYGTKKKCLCYAEGAYTATVGGDCNDQHVDVRPNQTKFFETSIGGYGFDFDYNCDGEGERRYAGRAPRTCERISAQSTRCEGAGEGLDSIWGITNCGWRYDLHRCPAFSATCTKEVIADVVQACR
jgi:hypothetical protein